MKDAQGGRSPDEGGPKRRAGFWATIRAVLWAFVGVRKRRDYHGDASSLDPRAVIVAGLLGGLLFVLAIIAVVRLVVGT